MTALSQYSVEELQHELHKRKAQAEPPVDLPAPYNNPVGIWHVTTEGDCEGKSTKDLGTHKGHIVDIAYRLAHRCFYSLCFKAVNPNELKKYEVENPPSEVHIQLDIDSKTWHMTTNMRSKALDKMLRSVPSEQGFEGVKDGVYYASGNLVFVPCNVFDRQIARTARDTCGVG